MLHGCHPGFTVSSPAAGCPAAQLAALEWGQEMEAGGGRAHKGLAAAVTRVLGGVAAG